MPTLWFSYSLPGGSLDIQEPLNSPYTISYHVGAMLRTKALEHGYTFQYVNLDSVDPVIFGPDDIAVGHLWDTSNSFMQQALNAEIKAKIVLQPYSHGMVSDGDIPRYIEMFQKADALLFVTGEYWYRTMQDSAFATLSPKVTRLDMAVNTALHPYSKTRWNRQGERALCVIGHDTPTKGYKNVAELARMSGFRLGHFGSAHPDTFAHVPCMVMHGGALFTPETIASLCQEYDALMVLALADANPTVILEAASWGLRVYCNQESGYLPHTPFDELRLNDLTFNVRQMRAFQEMDEYDLKRESQALRHTMEQDYTFDTMCATIWKKVSEYL